MSFVLRYAPILLSYYPFYFCIIVLHVLLTIFVSCDLNYLSLYILLFVPLVEKGKNQCQRVETQLQYINIVSYRNMRTKKRRVGL
jgi:hypothetical protein